MRIFKTPPRGHCASCEARIPGRPVYRMDEAYCCEGCAIGGPCVCDDEANLADDGVDGLGLPFAMPETIAAVAPDSRWDAGLNPQLGHARGYARVPESRMEEPVR